MLLLKLVEALKELKIIEKKIKKNNEYITEYCSNPKNMVPALGTENAQREKVKSLIQANMDLTKRYLRLKANIDYTNLNVKIGKYSLHELLDMKRKGTQFMITTYKSLNDSHARSLVPIHSMQDNKPTEIVHLYDKASRDEMLAKWLIFDEEMDGKIEVTNATTDLMIMEGYELD